MKASAPKKPKDDSFGEPIYAANAIEHMQLWMERYGKYIEKGLPIDFKGKLFVFTGFYDNDPLMQAVIDRGGICHSRITNNVDYLVVNPGEAGEGKIKEVLKKRGKGIFIHFVLGDGLEKRLKETPLP